MPRREMIHRLHNFDKQSTTADCDACGSVDIHWKSTGKGRPRMPVCRNAYDLDKKLQRLKNSDTPHAQQERARAELKRQYWKEQAEANRKPARDWSAWT